MVRGDMAEERKPRDISHQRRAKIICTLGPSTDDDNVLKSLIQGEMDGARVNLAFGTAEENIGRIQQLRRLEKEVGSQRPIAVIADLPGRKVRLGKLEGQKAQLEEGKVVSLVCDEGQSGSSTEIPVDRALFHEGMAIGDTIELAEGVVDLRVTQIETGKLQAEVIHGGTVKERTGIYSPGIPLYGTALTNKDLPLLETVAAQDVDFIALTYVTDGQDIIEARNHLQRLGKDISLIAKIDRAEAITRLDSILTEADAIMLRRGDLGTQLEISQVPQVQKDILRQAGLAGVPTIIATQMLGSMVSSPRPTRAEASDVSNTVADGADGVLLSAETAVGRFPLQSADFMSRIIRETEIEGLPFWRHSTTSAVDFPHAAARMACHAAAQTEAKLIACFTESGRTAMLVAENRPAVPIIACSSHVETRRKLALTWGITTDSLDPPTEVEIMASRVEERLLENKWAEVGDQIVIVYGAPVGTRGNTNSVRLHVVGQTKA